MGRYVQSSHNLLVDVYPHKLQSGQNILHAGSLRNSRLLWHAHWGNMQFSDFSDWPLFTGTRARLASGGHGGGVQKVWKHNHTFCTGSWMFREGLKLPCNNSLQRKSKCASSQQSSSVPNSGGPHCLPSQGRRNQAAAYL